MRAIEAEADARVGCRRRSVAPSSSAVAVLVVVDVETALFPSLECVVAAAAGVVLAVHRAEFFVVGRLARRAVGSSLSSLSLSAPHLGRVGFRVCVLLLEDDDDEVVRGALSMCVSSLTGGSESNALRVRKRERERKRARERKREREKERKRAREQERKRAREKESKRAREQESKREREKERKRAREKESKREREEERKRAREQESTQGFGTMGGSYGAGTNYFSLVY